MKIIHCADLHLDSRMETNLSSTQAAERKREILNTFERMVAYAAENAVQVIIIAGDMFDTARVSNLTKTRVLNTVTKHAEIDFLYLSGNHDESNFLGSLENVPANLKIFGSTWTTFTYPEVNITGLVLDESNRVTRYETLRLPNHQVNIAVLHGQITQSASGQNPVEMINLTKLQNKNIDYLALGHIHTFMKNKLDARGIYCYAGCLEGRGFDECGEKGFVLLDVDHGAIKSEFVSFAQRRLIELNFDITPYQDWFAIEEQILSITQTYSRENLLRIVLQGKYKIQMEKHVEMLQQKLHHFYFAEIKDESVLDVTNQDVAHDVSLRGEFIRQVLASSLSTQEKEQTILVGLKALNREDW